MRRICAIGALLLGALGVGATPLAACDPAWLPMSRPEGISIFAILALGDTVPDRGLAAGRRRLHPAFGERMEPIIGETGWGQRVRLLRWSEAGATAVREAVVVPWAYGPDCRPIKWRERLGWIPAGRRGTVTGWLRPRAGWIGGVPTFDVEMATLQPLWAEGEPRWSDLTSGARRMTPEEFTELYSALPTVELLERDPPGAAEVMRRWARAHPDLAKLPPAATVAGYVYRYAASRAGSEPH